jgi:hypothetical protein
MRRYSAAEQLPCAIIEARRVTVSHEESINSAIMIGREVGRRFRLLIAIAWVVPRPMQGDRSRNTTVPWEIPVARHNRTGLLSR